MNSEAFLRELQGLTEVRRGIAQLRCLVLELAVRGHLVPQLANEQPPPIEVGADPFQLPFSLPLGWRWTSLDSLAVVTDYGTSQKAHLEPSGVPVVRMNNIQDGRLDLTALKYVPESTDGLPGLLLAPGDLLFNRTNSYELVGKMAVFRESRKFTFASYLIRIRLGDRALPEYVSCWFGSPTCRDTQIEPNITRQTNQANFNGTKLRAVMVPLPPVAEQKRIVTKVNQLMALCDDLEAKQTRKRALATQTTRCALTSLTTAETDEDLSAAWKRVATDFDLTTSDTSTVDGMRSAIFGLAVRGRLDRQDPKDEPAVRLLTKIRPDLKPAEPNEPPFPLPRGWCWSTFADLGEFSRGKSKHRPRNDPKLYVNGKYPFVQTGDVARSGGTITTFSSRYNDVGLAQSRLWPTGTMCITIAANIADTGILTMDACFPDSVVGFIPAKPMTDARFFMYFVRTAQERIEQFAPSTAQKNINMEILSTVYVPVPPLAEQKRIVAKVQVFMSLLDDLEAKLSKQEETAARFAESLAAAVAT